MSQQKKTAATRQRAPRRQPPLSSRDTPTVAAGQSRNVREAVVALKREWIVATAVELFDQRGYEGTTLDAVAEELGVTKPFIYLHFNSKSDLLAEICSRGIGYSLRVAKKTIHDKGTPTERLKAFGREFVLAVLENQKHVAIFNREEKNLDPVDLKRINGLRREFDQVLTSLLREGMDSGEFGLKDAKVGALAIGGMVSWAYVWFKPNGRLSRDEIASQFTDLIAALARSR